MIRKILSILLSLVMTLMSGVSVASDPEVPEMSLFAINVRKADALLLRSGETVYLIVSDSRKHHSYLVHDPYASFRLSILSSSDIPCVHR